MSKKLVELCEAILEDHFGYYVSVVGRILVASWLPLAFIVRRLADKKLTVREIKRSLAILEQHSLLVFERSKNGGVMYHVDQKSVIRLIRVPRAILAVKTLFGEIAEAIFEEVLASGRICCSNCIRSVTKCIEKASNEEVKNKFVQLLRSQMLIRCPPVEKSGGDEDGFPVYGKMPDPFLMPSVVLDADEKTANVSTCRTSRRSAASGRKRKAPSALESDGDDAGPKADSDARVLWSVNWPRLERLFRDQVVLDAITQVGEQLDPTAVQVAQALLKVGEVHADSASSQSNAISFRDVCAYAKEQELPLSRETIDAKLQLVAEDSDGIVGRIGDTGGGLYVIDYGRAVERACRAEVDSQVREKLGDKALRLFRLLYLRGFVEEDQLEKAVMLAQKETRELCSALLDHGFIALRQVAKTSDFSPARTLFLYTVNWPQLLCTLVDFAHMTIRNVILRRNHEAKRNEQLVDRHLKMEIIKTNIEQDPSFDDETRRQQIADVQEAYLTEADRAELKRHRLGQQQLWGAEIELERALFTLEQNRALRWADQREVAAQLRAQKRHRAPTARLTAATL